MVGASDFREKGTKFGGLFLAGKGFDPAGNVDGKGAHCENGLGDVLGSESASKDDAV